MALMTQLPRYGYEVGITISKLNEGRRKDYVLVFSRLQHQIPSKTFRTESSNREENARMAQR